MPLPSMPKEESEKVSKWLAETKLPPMSWGPKKKQKELRDSDVADIVASASLVSGEFAFLPLTALHDGVHALPADRNAVSDQKATIMIGGQASLVNVRKHEDGRFEQLDGFDCTAALAELGHSNVAAVVFSGLTDWQANFRRVAGNFGQNLRILDKALLLKQLIELRAKKAMKAGAPLGGEQPTEKYHRKLAKELNLTQSKLSKLQQIARVLPPVQVKVRELKLDNNQPALLKIAGAGEDTDAQMAKVQELSKRAKKAKAETPTTLPNA